MLRTRKKKLSMKISSQKLIFLHFFRSRSTFHFPLTRGNSFSSIRHNFYHNMSNESSLKSKQSRSECRKCKIRVEMKNHFPLFFSVLTAAALCDVFVVGGFLEIHLTISSLLLCCHENRANLHSRRSMETEVK